MGSIVLCLVESCLNVRRLDSQQDMGRFDRKQLTAVTWQLVARNPLSPNIVM